MNPLSVHKHFHAVPEGYDIGKISQRTTCAVGLAIGAMVQLPGADVTRTNLRNYFMDNSTVLRQVAFEINETVPFNVDRAVDYGYRVFEQRYSIAHFCEPHDLLEPFQIENHAPEFGECCIDRSTLAKTMECLREGVREKTGA